MDKSSEQSSEAEFRVDSWMQSVVPSIPRFCAVICLILNILVPGLGTITGGIMSCFCGRPRLDFRPTRHRCPMALFVVGIGVLQLASVAFFLVGWLWSIIWGFLMVNLSGPEFRKLPPLPCPTPSTAGTRKSLGHHSASRNSILQIQDNDPPGKKNFARLIAKANSNRGSDSSLVADSTTDLRDHADDDDDNDGRMAATHNHLDDHRPTATADVETEDFRTSPTDGSPGDLISLAGAAGQDQPETKTGTDPAPAGSLASIRSRVHAQVASIATSKSEDASVPERASAAGSDATTSGSVKPKRVPAVEALRRAGATKMAPSPSLGSSNTIGSTAATAQQSLGAPEVEPATPLEGGGHDAPSRKEPEADNGAHPLESVVSEHPPAAKPPDTGSDKTGSPPGGYSSSEPDTGRSGNASSSDPAHAVAYRKFKPMSRGQTGDLAMSGGRGTASSSGDGGGGGTLSRVGLPDFASMSLPNFQLPVAATKTFLASCYRSVAGMVHKASSSLNHTSKATSESCSDLLGAGEGRQLDHPEEGSIGGTEARRFRSSVHRIFSGWKRRALKVSTVQLPSTLDEEVEDGGRAAAPPRPTSPARPEEPPTLPAEAEVHPPPPSPPDQPAQHPVATRAPAKTRITHGNHVTPGPIRRGPAHAAGGQQRARLSSTPPGVGPTEGKPTAATGSVRKPGPAVAPAGRDPMPLNAGRLQKTNAALSNRPPAVNTLRVKQAPAARKPRSRQGATYHFNA